MTTIKRICKLMFRLGLFVIVLGLGAIAALMIDETRSLALADLTDVSAQAMTTTPDGNTLYTNFVSQARPGGVYRSNDDGRTWQRVSAESGLAFNALGTHPAKESVLYAGTAGGPIGKTNNVWRSEDGGQTWHNFNLSLPASPERMIPAVTAVVPDPARPEILYVATGGQGVYRFVEGQVGYELVGGTSLYAAHVKALAVGSDSRLYALTNGGLFINTGAAWQKIESLPETPISLALAPSDPQRLYVGSASVGAYRSTDGGQTWAHIGYELGMTPGAMLRVTALAVDRQNPDHVVAATAYGLGRQLAPAGIYESLTAGQNWAKIADTDNLVEQLTLNKGSIIATTEKGLARYGQAVEVTETPSFTALHSLARPTGVQMLILVSAVGLAGLALLARPEWILRRRASATVNNALK